MKIYVPDLENYECFVIRDENIIRAYQKTPMHNSTIDYRDYYYNSNYMFQDGSQNFSQYSTLPVCLPKENLTNDFYYRNDFDKILFIFLVFFLFIIYFPYKIFSRFFGRWLKL